MKINNFVKSSKWISCNYLVIILLTFEIVSNFFNYKCHVEHPSTFSFFILNYFFF